MKKIIYIIILVVMIIFITYWRINQNNYEEYDEIEIINNLTQETEEEKTIKIHIAGAIQNPGIIEIQENARIADVIEKAGGLTKEADITNVNLAYQIEDGQKIYIPSINEKLEVQIIISDSGEGILQTNDDTKNKININTATQVELETLPGIGPSTALKIVRYREENGKFKQIEDIKEVEGIGELKYEKIKDYISIE